MNDGKNGTGEITRRTFLCGAGSSLFFAAGCLVGGADGMGQPSELDSTCGSGGNGAIADVAIADCAVAASEP